MLTHRWVGIAFCGLFMAWFLSGIVMMYSSYPALSNDERISHLPMIDSRAIKLTPLDALLRSAIASPDQMTVSSLENRPVYRIRAKSHIATVFADSGELFSGLDEQRARKIASRWTGQPEGDANLEGTLTAEDQWTVTAKYRPYRPLWKFSWPNGEAVYISDVTGEVVQHTDRGSRINSYFGAIPHWIYFTQLRRDAARWNVVVIWTSGIGAVMTLLGLIVGVWLYSPSARYRFEGKPSRVPFAGNRRLHIIIGLLFGLFTFTWVLSGMFSMSILQAKPDPIVGKVRKALNDQSWLPSEWRLAEVQSLRALSAREIDFVRYLDSPAFSLHLEKQERMVALHGDTIAPDRAAIESAFVRAVVPSHVVRSRVISEYELYYVDRHNEKPLPALYLETDHDGTSAFYIDLKTGRLVQTYGVVARWNRWLYHGLHSWDLPWLYRHRPLWDILVILGLCGGILLSWTAIVAGSKRLVSVSRSFIRNQFRRAEHRSDESTSWQ